MPIRLIFILVYVLTEVSTSFAAPKINFQDALRIAREKSPDFDTAKRLERNAQLGYKNSWATLLPQLDIQAQHYYNLPVGTIVTSTLTPTGYLTVPASPWSNLLAVNVSENFYDNGDSYRLMKIADLNRESVRLDLSRQSQQLLLKVSKAFYTYSQAAANLALQRQELETVRQQFRTIEGRYRQGVSSNRDYLRIKAQLQRSEVDLANQQISLEETLQSLRLALGLREAAEFIPLEPNPQETASLTFPDIHAEETIDYKIASLQNRISEIKYETIARKNWPTISLKGAYGYNDPQYIGAQIPGASPYWDFQLSLVLDYPLWDWGIKSRNVEIADNQRNIENDSQESLRIQVAQDLNKLEAQISFYRESFVKSQQILKDEEDVYSSLNRGYRDGKVTYLDLITALGELYSARSQFLNLEFSLLTIRANLAYYQGNLDEFLTPH